jgi:hypothetical protein
LLQPWVRGHQPVEVAHVRVLGHLELILSSRFY